MSYTDNDYINLEYYGGFQNMPNIIITDADKSRVDNIYINSSFSGKVLAYDGPVLSRTVAHCIVDVTKSGIVINDGPISVGDVLTITATADSGYTMSTLTVNGESHTSGQAITVSGDVVIEAVATETPVEEWEQIWSASNCAFTTYQGQAGFIMYQDGESAFSAISDLNTTDDFKIEITELSLSAETKFTVEDGTYYSAMGQEYNVMGTFGANLVMVLGQNTTKGSYTIKLYKKTQ